MKKSDYFMRISRGSCLRLVQVLMREHQVEAISWRSVDADDNDFLILYHPSRRYPSLQFRYPWGYQTYYLGPKGREVTA
jgi:hypothetical protein